mgnify:CR=1 FL=1|tara:strand:+ start:113 stop:598 length:486 start_codon:yes stop_codon:yes gene_type:complete
MDKLNEQPVISNPLEHVVMLQDYMGQGKFNVDYIVDKDKRVVGVSHPDWPFTIMRNQDNKTETAIVCNNTDEPFGILDSDVFNTILMCWLLIDDPKLIDEAMCEKRANRLECELIKIRELLGAQKDKGILGYRHPKKKNDCSPWSVVDEVIHDITVALNAT